ncbi:MAG TPA: STAS domain-containing protein [Candidatus Dormibacteraeota bacterium]|jgi:rsbT antagonist protein RsbS|nr:STAS domain-containing protein [Candidatus Dormibacteraeota bacterium]
MPVPILKQGNYLIAPIQASLTDEQMLLFRSKLAEEVGRTRVSGVVIDVSGLDVIDSFTARTLQDVTRMVKLRGAEAVVVGIQPALAFAMIQLGLGLEGVATALDLEEGLELIKWLGLNRHARGR